MMIEIVIFCASFHDDTHIAFPSGRTDSGETILVSYACCASGTNYDEVPTAPAFHIRRIYNPCAKTSCTASRGIEDNPRTLRATQLIPRH